MVGFLMSLNILGMKTTKITWQRKTVKPIIYVVIGFYPVMLSNGIIVIIKVIVAILLCLYYIVKFGRNIGIYAVIRISSLVR